MDIQRRVINSDEDISDINNSSIHVSDDCQVSEGSGARSDIDDKQEAISYDLSFLITFCQIVSIENNIPCSVMSVLSITCKELYNSIQWRLNKLKSIRDKYMNRFADNLYKKLIGHPFTYSGSKTKIIHIGEMSYGPFGLGILNVPGELFDSEFMSRNKIAFINACAITHSPEEFNLVVYATNEAPIINITISKDDYIDLGEITPDIRNKLVEKYGDYEFLHPGRYFIDFNLATKNNPIVLGDGFIDRRLLSFQFSSYTNVQWSAVYIAQLFSHFIVNFKYLPCDKYNWDEYALMFNDKINMHVRTTSLIRRRECASLWVPLKFWFNHQIVSVPKHALDYIDIDSESEYSGYESSESE